MKMKNSTTSIANLNPIFTDYLQKFDLLHRQLTGNEAVVTSVDTGKHWGSIKKENRPVGWEQFTEAQVREWSDSKHYNIPCDALDFRRRNREPDKNSDAYFDELTESEQRYFMAEIYKCFPDHIFDIVFSRLCIHVERDPNKPRPLENDENRTDDDLDPREPNAAPPLEGKSKPTELPKLPIWRKSGFKRVTGFIGSSLGFILQFFSEYQVVGNMLIAIFGPLGIGGMIHGKVKNRKAEDKTQLILSIVKWIWGQITKLLTSRKENKDA